MTEVGPSDTEISYWRMLRKAVQHGMESRGISVADQDLNMVTRFILEEIEGKGFYVVPGNPNRAMIAASVAALDEGNRLNTRYVDARTKHRWRVAAAFRARPQWRPGYDHEVGHFRTHGSRPPAPGYSPTSSGDLVADDTEDAS